MGRGCELRERRGAGGSDRRKTERGSVRGGVGGSARVAAQKRLCCVAFSLRPPATPMRRRRARGVGLRARVGCRVTRTLAESGERARPTERERARESAAVAPVPAPKHRRVRAHRPAIKGCSGRVAHGGGKDAGRATEPRAREQERGGEPNTPRFEFRGSGIVCVCGLALRGFQRLGSMFL